MKIISGTKLAQKIKNELKEKIPTLIQKYGRAPHITLVLVGNNPSNVSLVHLKDNACHYTGIESDILTLDEHISESELLSVIDKLNADKRTDAILIQLPIPEHLNKNKIIEHIALEKDVDAFNPINISNLATGQDCIYPPTPKGIITMLKSENIEIKGKHAVVIGRSNLVGKPMAQMLLRENASVTICHSKTKNLSFLTRQAEILIVAIGRPGLITADMLKPDAAVIDVGINSVNGKLVGDVQINIDVNSVEDVASYLTPVPGGVGPMTIASLLENIVEIYEKRMIFL